MSNIKMYTTHILLPVILCSLSKTNGQIEINIHVSDSNEITVRTTGQSETTNLESGNHRDLFHITDELLQKTLFLLTGLETEVFLNNDNDIYNNYKLEPIKVTLKPNGTKVVKVSKEEVNLNKLQAFNHEEFEKSQVITLSGSVEDNVTCIYKQKDVFPAEITHIIDIKSIGKSWDMKSSFGRDISETQLIPIANANFTVHLGPKQDALAILGATKITAIIQINYIAVLTGNVIAKFDSSYVWGYDHYDIKTIMDEAKMPDSVILREEITVEFYTNCSIRLYGGNIYAANDVNQCLFTIVNETNNQNINWNTASEPQQNLAFNALPKPLNPGNSAKRDTVTMTTLIFAILLVIYDNTKTLRNVCVDSHCPSEYDRPKICKVL